MYDTYVRKLSREEEVELKRRAILAALHQVAQDGKVDPDCEIITLNGTITIQVYIASAKPPEHDLVEIRPDGVSYICTFAS